MPTPPPNEAVGSAEAAGSAEFVGSSAGDVSPLCPDSAAIVDEFLAEDPATKSDLLDGDDEHFLFKARMEVERPKSLTCSPSLSQESYQTIDKRRRSSLSLALSVKPTPPPKQTTVSSDQRGPSPPPSFRGRNRRMSKPIVINAKPTHESLSIFNPA